VFFKLFEITEHQTRFFLCRISANFLQKKEGRRNMTTNSNIENNNFIFIEAYVTYNNTPVNECEYIY